MGLQARLRRLDRRVLGPNWGGMSGPILPVGLLPDIPRSPGPVAGYFARIDRQAARRAPDRMAAAINNGVLWASQAFLWFVIIANPAVGPSFKVFEIMTGVVLLGMAFVVGLHRWRREESRSRAIYGADWRDLSREERQARWDEYCRQWSAFAYSQNPWSPPSDLRDPYASLLV
jgi:hypothetical protein